MVEADRKLVSGLIAKLRERLGFAGARTEDDPELLRILEKTVDGTDSRIRLVGGYRKRLIEAVRTSRHYVRQLVQAIPSLIEVSTKNFASDPHVNAFFANTDELRLVFSKSSELRDFLEDAANRRVPEGCALLCMRKSEKTQLGVELAGDMLRRDVVQTSVNFSDHHVLSPSQTEEDARKGLQNCFYDGLLTNALHRISSQRQRRKVLENRRSLLTSKLRRLQLPGERSAAGPAQVAERDREIQFLQDRVQVLEQELQQIPVMTPEACLDEVCSVLGCPEDYIKVQRQSMRVDKLGLKTDDPHRPHNALELTEVRIGGQEPRMVVLARFRHAEILPFRPTRLA